jgi:ribosomal protein S27AE
MGIGWFYAWKVYMDVIASDEVVAKRLKICSKCEHLMTSIANIKLCGKCGCVIKVKVKVKSTTCPVNKW